MKYGNFSLIIYLDQYDLEVNRMGLTILQCNFILCIEDITVQKTYVIPILYIEVGGC